MGGALDAGEQTVVARMMLTAAKMTHGEATTGRRKAGGWALGKDAKQVSSKTCFLLFCCLLYCFCFFINNHPTPKCARVLIIN